MDGHAVKLAEGPILLVLERPADMPGILRVARRLCLGLDRSAILVAASIPALPPEVIAGRLGSAAAELGGIVVAPLLGDPGQAIPAYAREHQASLLVSGLPDGPLLPEGTTARLLSEAPCPVLLVPATLRPGWGEGGTVLLPLDGTPSTSGAVPWATEFALRLGAPLEILYAAGNPPPAEPGSLSAPAFADQPQHEWPMWRREFLDRFCACHLGKGHPLEPSLAVKIGPPAEAILDHASKRSPDLIVLGWHGHLNGGHAATLRAVLEGACWPVLAVRVTL